jgi:hypothetical protein
MSARLQTIIDEEGMFEALSRLAASPESVGLSTKAAQKRLMAVAQLPVMPAERSALLVQIVNAYQALSLSDRSTGITDYIRVLSTQQTNLSPGSNRVRVYIKESGIVSTLEKALAAPSLFGVTDRELADKLRLIREILVKPDRIANFLLQLNSA